MPHTFDFTNAFAEQVYNFLAGDEQLLEEAEDRVLYNGLPNGREYEPDFRGAAASLHRMLQRLTSLPEHLREPVRINATLHEVAAAIVQLRLRSVIASQFDERWERAKQRGMRWFLANDEEF